MPYKKDINRVVSLEEALLYIDVLDRPRDKALVALLHLTGARPTEIREVRKEHITVEENQVKILMMTAKLKGVPGFFLRERILVFKKDAPGIGHFLDWYSVCPTPDLFRGTHGKPISTTRIRQLVYKASGNAICPYHFRHSRLTKLARSGWGADQLMYWKGSRTVRSVSVYIASKPVTAPDKLD